MLMAILLIAKQGMCPLQRTAGICNACFQSCCLVLEGWTHPTAGNGKVLGGGGGKVGAWDDAVDRMATAIKASALLTGL